MLIANGGPDWLGSPQHIVGGIGLALIVVAAARLSGIRPWLAFALAVGAASTAEILVELVEYPLLYSDTFHRSAYWDTLSDMASTLVGGVVGAAATACWSRSWTRTWRWLRT
jgi:hypothetical protein